MYCVRRLWMPSSVCRLFCPCSRPSNMHSIIIRRFLQAGHSRHANQNQRAPMKKAAHRHFPKHWKLKSRPTPAPISAESATQETVVLERCCESPGLACRSTIASEGTVRCHTMRRGAMRIVEDVTGLPDLPIVLIIQSRQIRRLCCCSRSQSASAGC